MSTELPDTMMTKGTFSAGPYRSETFSRDDLSLECEAGPYAGHKWPLERELLLVGRGAWCDIPLGEDGQISRHHCELRLSDEGIRVRDLGSRNGTFVSDVRIFEALLSPGQSLRVGHTPLLVRAHEARREITVDYYDKSGLLVGQSPQMRKIFSLLSLLAPVDEPIVLYGETGTGKSSVAQALHEQSNRAHKPFVTVNCGALPENLVESMLFGYEKGAFTGADKRHKGYFEQAHGGTLFLDEIAELPLTLQPKLLDVLERKMLRRLGSEQEIAVDFRLVAATHRDLKAAVAQKAFREDLYYRIAVVEEVIPPLRERLMDLPLLAGYLLASLRPQQNLSLDEGAIARLQSFFWPGNVRQLRNVLARSIVLFQGEVLGAADIELPRQTSVEPAPQAAGLSSSVDDSASLAEKLAAYEVQLLAQALDATEWNVPEAARNLGIARSSLYNRIAKYELKKS